MSARTRLLAASLGCALVSTIGFAPEASAIPPNFSGPIAVPLRLGFGGGVAGRFVDGGWRAAFPLELTVTPVAFVTTSAGVVFSGGGVDHAYVELGVWMFASLAGGVGFGAYDSPQGRKEGGTVHLFVGLPIPLRDGEAAVARGTWFPYLQPYYRPSWGPWPGTAHEVGLMMKVSYGLRSR